MYLKQPRRRYADEAGVSVRTDQMHPVIGENNMITRDFISPYESLGGCALKSSFADLC